MSQLSFSPQLLLPRDAQATAELGGPAGDAAAEQIMKEVAKKKQLWGRTSTHGSRRLGVKDDKCLGLKAEGENNLDRCEEWECLAVHPECSGGAEGSLVLSAVQMCRERAGKGPGIPKNAKSREQEGIGLV